MLLKVKINTFYYLCGHIIFVPQYKVPDLTSSMKVAQPLRRSSTFIHTHWIRSNLLCRTYRLLIKQKRAVFKHRIMKKGTVCGFMELQFLNSMQIVHSISYILLWDIPRDRRKRVEGYNINSSFSLSPEFAGQDCRR